MAANTCRPTVYAQSRAVKHQPWVSTASQLYRCAVWPAWRTQKQSRPLQ